MRRLVLYFTLLVILSFSFTSSFAQTCTSPSGVPVTMCSPTDGSTVSSPVHELVATNDPGHTISAIYTYVDNVVVRKDYAPSVDAYVPIATGAHNIRVQVWDNVGNLFKAGSNITVVSGAVAVSVSPSSATVNTGASQQFQASVTGSTNTAVNWSVDGVAGGNSTVGMISTTGLYTAPATAGSHTVTATSQADTTKSGSASVTVTTASSGGGACTSPSGVPVTMCSPVDGSTVSSPVHELVATNDPGHTISAIYTYVDNVVVRKDYAPSVDAYVTIASGAHNIRVQVWDNAGNLFKTGSNITVSSGTASVSVAVSPTSASVATGATQQFQATVSGSTNTAVTWSVDGIAGGNSTVGTISAAGLYAAPGAAGTHTVTATSQADTTKSANASVTVTATSSGGGSCTSPSGVPVTMCSPVNGSTVSSPVHEQVATNDPGHVISAIYTYVDNVNVRKDYTPSVDAYVTIASGAHNIRVQVWDNAGNLFQAGSNITVVAGVTVAISPTSATVQEGQSQQFQATVSGSTNTAVNWSVDGIAGGNTTVGTIDSTGMYAAPNSTGNHTVTATSQADTTKSASAAVTVDVPQVTVTVSPSSATVLASGTQQFSASVTNTSNTTVTWSVDGVAGGNSTVGTVDSTGLYTAPATSGSHTVTATSVADTTKSGNASVKVTTVSVVVSPSTATITLGQTQQFTAQVANSTNQAVTWQVDGTTGGNTTVGTISTAGLYTPPSTTGSHTITAISQADATKSGTATIHVSNFSGVFTYHGDNMISGLNSLETVLTPSNVNVNQFGKLFTRATDGYVFAQPLYVPNVNIPGQGTFNVVYIATEHDSIYAYDADGKVSTPLWHRSLINSAAGITTIPSADANNSDEGPEIGITGTPVIDPSTSTMYLVAATKENGAYFQRIHALDITTGAERSGSPVTITGSVSGTGKGNVSGVITFDPLISNQRPALLLDNGVIYVGFASHGDQGNYHGWLFAYAAGTLAKKAQLNLSPNGWAGGIWSAGAGFAADGNGNVYTVTGNGTFDFASGGKDLGDTFLKLNSSVSILDYFTPYNQASLSSGDLDVGSSGVLLVPDDQTNTVHTHLMIGSNKSGDLYVIDRDAMGHYQTSSNNNIVQYLPRALGNNTTSGDQYFGVGAYWNGNLYFAGSYDKLKQFSLTSGLLSATPVAQSPEVVATYRSARPVVSSNGKTNAIVWVISTDSGATKPTLRAYSATNISQEIYNSLQNATRDTPTGGILKFNSPTVANGRVFVVSQKEIDVYGLLQP